MKSTEKYAAIISSSGFAPRSNSFQVTERTVASATHSKVLTTDFPVTTKLEKAKPVLKKLPGWKTDIRGIKKYEDLPENCRKYVEFIEEQIGYPITMVSNGPGRNDIIYR